MRKGNTADYLPAIQAAIGAVWIQMDMLPISNIPVIMLVNDLAFIQNHQHLGNSMFHEL